MTSGTFACKHKIYVKIKNGVVTCDKKNLPWLDMIFIQLAVYTFSTPSPRLGDRKHTTRWIKIICNHKPWGILYLFILNSIENGYFCWMKRCYKTCIYSIYMYWMHLFCIHAAEIQKIQFLLFLWKDNNIKMDSLRHSVF